MVESIKERLLSDKNIFLSIYLVDSYILNRELLSSEDRKRLAQLKDIFHKKTIEQTIEEVKTLLTEIIENETKYFEINVYFMPKKFNNGKIEFRPIHTSSLIQQIAMIAMLQTLVYDISEDKKLIPSELSRLIPSNFYGNRISFDGKRLFKRWQDQYQEYCSKANEMLERYCETWEYKYEVSLDLEKFFPSINPKVIYNMLCKYLPLRLNEGDITTYRIIIRKLLLFKLGKLEGEELSWYLSQVNSQFNEVELQQKCLFAKGLPQGLPHTYFIANIFMLSIKKIYMKVFPGEMLFYVDDSVIFTNGKEGELTKEKFYEAITELNKYISEYEDQNLKEFEKEYENLFPQEYKYTEDDFGVRVHDKTDKSVYSEINDAKENAGQRYLYGLSRETSNINYDIYTTFSDEEVSMIRGRIEAILEIINRELDRVLPDIEKKKVYIEKLKRYKKFFAYRKTILDYKNTGTVKELKKSIIRDISSRKKELSYFFEKYNDGILAATIGFVFKRCAAEAEDVNDLVEAVNGLISSLYGSNINHSYIAKAYEPYLKGKPEYYEVAIYKSLRNLTAFKYRSIREQSNQNKYNKFKEIINGCKNDCYYIFELLDLGDLYKYSEYVRYSNNNLERMIINSIFSYIFGYEIDDSLNLAKTNRNPIQYSEVRILAALRNNIFNLSDFYNNFQSFVEDEFLQNIDYTLLQVLDVFKILVSQPRRIDSLILIHKYCCDTWKNGSKYLHFYTLHNQEHAVSLIKSSIKILHAVSYFKIKKIDYYVLFASCYLHDISMVTLPDISEFYIGDIEDANIIYTNFINSLDIEDIKRTKKDLCFAYQRIDQFFESDIRRKHSYNSAKEIRNYPELNFIESTMRELIAEVSEAHGYDTADIYLLKSTGTTSLVNNKFVKILLRLCDLLDISRYRISKVILDHNLKNLSKESRFHWISHLITDGYSLDTVYVVPERISDDNSSCLKRRIITEKLILTVYVLMSQTTEVPKPDSCKHIAESILGLGDDGRTKVTILCDNDVACKTERCNFLCKWFVTKNSYLFKELGALKQYLNSIESNYFSSDIEVQLKVISNTNIPNDSFDYLKEYVETV